MKVQNADIGGGSNQNVGGPEIEAAHKNQKAQ